MAERKRSKKEIQHRVLVGYIRAILDDRVARGHYSRSQAKDIGKHAQGDFDYARGLAAMLHQQNLALQESEDRRGITGVGENRGRNAGHQTRRLRDVTG
jgi:hypothetical protein